MGTNTKAYARQHYEQNREAYIARAKENNRRYIDRNRRFVLAYLKEHPCVDCGEPDHRVLQFDHVRGVKVETVGRLVQNCSSVKRITEEIEKCEVRCANCHFKRTADQQGWYAWIAPV